MSHRRKEKDKKKALAYRRKMKQGAYIRQIKGVTKPPADPAPKAESLDCAFEKGRSCTLDFDCEKCEHLPRDEYDKYRGNLKSKKAAREKKLGQKPSKRTEIRCHICGKIVGYIYEKLGPFIIDGAPHGPEELIYCTEHLPKEQKGGT